MIQQELITVNKIVNIGLIFRGDPDMIDDIRDYFALLGFEIIYFTISDQKLWLTKGGEY
jgi:hypothetical protein